MCWLTSYDWIMWAIVGAVAVLLLRRANKVYLPAAVIVYLSYDILRDLMLAVPAYDCAPTAYTELWWLLKYGDYAIKIWLLVWAGVRVLTPIKRITFFYALTGTITLTMVACKIGPPWQAVVYHDTAMLVLAQAANVLCVFLGIYIALLEEGCWYTVECGVALGVLAWAALALAAGMVQLHYPTSRWAWWARESYPWAELLMFLSWWWATSPTLELAHQKRLAADRVRATQQPDHLSVTAIAQRQWVRRQATRR